MHPKTINSVRNDMCFNHDSSCGAELVHLINTIYSKVSNNKQSDI